MKPTFRFGTKKAIEEVSKKLNIFFDDSIQDWSYTAGDCNDIEKYIRFYLETKNEDEKFVLMELIIQAVEDQNTEELLNRYFIKIEQIIKRDFNIHCYTVFYWCSFEEQNINNTWKIAPMMRKIWNETNNI